MRQRGGPFGGLGASATGGEKAASGGEQGATGTDGLSRHYPARPESVPALRRAVVEFARGAGASAETVDAVELAVSEAATNVVVHAYRDSEPGVVEVAAALTDGELWVLIADAGSGLQPRRDSPGLGLGLGLIAQVSDGVDLVHRSGGGLELRIRFVLEGRPDA